MESHELLELFKESLYTLTDAVVKEKFDSLPEFERLRNGSERDCFALGRSAKDKYILIHVIMNGGQYEGNMIELPIDMDAEIRTRLVMTFSKQIAVWYDYEDEEAKSMFNTLQKLQRVYFEKMGYHVMSDEAYEMLSMLADKEIEFTYSDPSGNHIYYFPYLT